MAADFPMRSGRSAGRIIAPVAAQQSTVVDRPMRSMLHRGGDSGIVLGNVRGVGMHLTRLLCVIGVGLCAVVAIAGQPAAPAALSTELQAVVRDGRFGVVTSIRGLPLGVRDALQTLFGTRTLDIAEPGAEFQRTDVIVTPNLPIRRLVAAGCSTTNHCLVYYERGGIAHTWHVALFRWTPEATRFEWGGAAPGGLRNIDDVRKAVLSGAIKSGAARF